MDALRSQTQMTHDRDPGLNDRLDLGTNGPASLDLHALRATILDQASGVRQRLLDRDLVAQERHISA